MTDTPQVDMWEQAILIVSRLPIDNAAPNFLRAGVFKAEAVKALEAARDAQKQEGSQQEVERLRPAPSNE